MSVCGENSTGTYEKKHTILPSVFLSKYRIFVVLYKKIIFAHVSEVSFDRFYNIEIQNNSIQVIHTYTHINAIKCPTISTYKYIYIV